MSGFPLASFSVSERSLFSPQEIRDLMAIESARARRYGFPVALLLIEVDRLETLHDLYGVESKREILNGVVGILRAETRASDFIGCLDDDRVIALFPHTAAAGASALAGRLLRACRKLDFQSDGRSLRATLSIGASVAEPRSGVPFADLVQATEEALRFAIVEGGDRFVLRQPASEFFEELRGELEEEARRLGEEHRRLLFEMAHGEEGAPPRRAPLRALPPPEPEALEAPGQPPAAPAPHEPLPGDDVALRLHELFLAVDRHAPDWETLERDVSVLAASAVARARGEAEDELSNDHARKVDVLERRVAKLKELLDSTEAELLQIARLKGVETGIASIYKTVQGLSDEESERGRKKEMLSLLFEANVELRRQIKEKP